MSREFDEVDLSRIKTIPLSKRPSLASADHLAKIPPTGGARRFFDSLPRFLKANDLKSLIDDIIQARETGKPVIVMAGGHLIKVGLNPIIIDLMKRGLISGLCLSGAGLIHDSEMAMIGQTSEDVADGLADGSFGMAEETAGWFADIVAHARAESIGLGRAAGDILNRRSVPHRDHSLLAACRRHQLPAMIFIAVDTDIVCQHPNYDPAAAAQASHRDFKILAHQLSQAEDGGVVINIGSAVVMPEVFLKALTVARNIYSRPFRLTTANFDMINHYRPMTNVVNRPTMHGGRGFFFTGHHELMIPLLAWGLKAFRTKASRKKSKGIQTKKG